MQRKLATIMLFMVTACLLGFEVALTRVCSVLLQYHISFAVVSLAILGLGLGGFLGYLWTRSHPERIPTVASLALMVLSPSILLAVAILLLLPFAERWPLMLVLVLPVFVFTGVFQSLVLRAFSAHATILYAADLTGGAVGALLAVVAIDTLGGPVNSMLLLSVGMAVCAALWCKHLAMNAPGEARIALRSSLALALLAAFTLATQFATGFLDVDYTKAPGKLITQMMQSSPAGRPHLVPELQRWDAYSRVDVLELRSLRGTQRLVFIDGETPTPMLEVGSDSPGKAVLDIRQTLPALPYRLLQPRRVLSIGSGAGYDVVVARKFDVTHIDAVELNAGVLDVVDQCRDFTGDVYNQPGVQLHHAEGRLFARRAPAASYDLILMALAQSLAGNLKEFALSENYLYTIEAFTDYLQALKPDGAMAFLLNNPTLLRKLSRTAFEVLEARNLPAARCIVALGSSAESPYDQFLLLRTRPFEQGELQALADEVLEHGYTPLHLPPGTRPDGPQLSTADLEGDHRWRLEPASDDQPFFFNVLNETPRGLQILLMVASGLLLLAWGAILAAGRRTCTSPVRYTLQGGYFILLGLGFMMVEVLVLQKTILMLGFPTLNLAVILATFLLAAGLGSAASGRLGAAKSRRRLQLVIACLGCLLIFLLPCLEAVHPYIDPFPLPLRCLLLATVLFPFAFLMGMPFPSAIRLLPRDSIELVPWFWGLNGVASIVGSALAVAVVLEAGFRLTSLLPVILYGLAALCAGFLCRGAGEAPADDGIRGTIQANNPV